MKKLVYILLAAALLPTVSTAGKAVSADSLIEGNCKSACLIDYYTGECLYEYNERARIPIASVCKVMTLILTFDAVREGKLDWDDQISVSASAAGMGGSQVFLEAGASYPLTQLIKSIVVCSANDSCVAIAEAVSGCEKTFVEKMNAKARDLGCADTVYSNCTGLPGETQYSCAADVAKTYRHLIGNEEYFSYSKVWLEDFVHPDDRITQMTNTNKLLRKYSPCDGGKTGFTNEAGFCLAATAMSNNLRLISVVLGADSGENRFKTAQSLFEYGFANYKNQIVLDGSVNLNDGFAVIGGKKKFIAVRPERNSYVFTANGATPEITSRVLPDRVKAPIAEGAVVGKIEVYKNGVLCDIVNAVASESADRASYGDYLKDVANEWGLR